MQPVYNLLKLLETFVTLDKNLYQDIIVKGTVNMT